MYTYAWYHWLTFFYIYCFCGWVFESTYVSLKQHHFVNRGFLRLPMLPLYGHRGGDDAVGIPARQKQSVPGLLLWRGGSHPAGIRNRLCDGAAVQSPLLGYSNQKFNLHGYICLTSSIAWGFLTIFMTEVIHKPIEHFVLNLPPALEWCLLGAVSGCFVMDTIQSTKEALSLAKALESVAKLRAELEEMQVQLALLKAETAQNIENAKKELRVAVAENVEAGKEKAAARREALEEAVAAHKETVAARRDELAETAVAHKAALAARISSLNEKMADTAVS